MAILKHVPAPYIAYQSQEDYLNWVEQNAETTDVSVGIAPTAAGKSLQNVTAGRYFVAEQNMSVALMAPRKILQDQYTDSFGWLPTLKGMGAYICTDCMMNPGTSCRTRKNNIGKCCGEECPYIQARGAAASAKLALFNFHSYYVNKMHKDVAIIDEGHGAIDLLYGLFGKKLWKCEVGYADDVPMTPAGISDVIQDLIGGLEMRLEMLLKNRMDDKMIESLQDEIESFAMVRQALEDCGADFLIKKKKDLYFGNMKEFKQTEQEYIYVKTLRIDKLAERVLWPRDKVKKIMLTSATISKEDIELLGLADRRVKYYECPSNIPWEQRMFVIDPVANMSYKHRAESLPIIAKKIVEIAAQHKDQKGIVHATYEVARQLKVLLGERGRFMYHDNRNKDEVLAQFIASKGNKILVASGMSEGIDMKDDLARFQVLTGLIFPSLADDVMAWMALNFPNRYRWMAIRDLIQRTGRIVRHPTDYGVTYFIGAELDKRFFYATEWMWPKWFKDAMVWLKE